MSTTPPHEPPAPPRAYVARAAAALTLGIGIFGAVLAWCPTTLLGGDGAVVLTGAGAILLPFILSRIGSERGVIAATWIASTAVGGLLGASEMYAMDRRETDGMASGVSLWLGLATLRAACAMPLALTLRRGLDLTSLDALDRVMLRASLWLLAALTEAALVLRLTTPGPYGFTGLSGPALGVSFFAMGLLAGLTALAALVRSMRWFVRWWQVTRGRGLRLVAASAWGGPPPTAVWFEGLGESDAVVVRTVAREGHGYREGDVALALGRAPSDAMRVAGSLLLRALVAGALLMAAGAVTTLLVAPLRW